MTLGRLSKQIRFELKSFSKLTGKFDTNQTVILTYEKSIGYLIYPSTLFYPPKEKNQVRKAELESLKTGIQIHPPPTRPNIQAASHGFYFLYSSFTLEQIMPVLQKWTKVLGIKEFCKFKRKISVRD